MVVHACQDVDAGEEIVWSYVPPTMDHKRRRAILERQHGFICRCQRCLVEESLLASGVPPSVTEWNDRLVDVSALDDGQAQSLRSAFDSIDAMLWSTAAPFSNEAKRFLRVGYTCLQMNYLNLALAKLSNEQSIDDDRIRSSLLNLATQLHFSFCACHNGSTEDLSVRRKKLICCAIHLTVKTHNRVGLLDSSSLLRNDHCPTPVSLGQECNST